MTHAGRLVLPQDYGNTDPFAFCPHVKPFVTVGGQAYASNQLNVDKNPQRPLNTGMYWMPDYNYYYNIPQIGLEVVAIDRNSNDINGLGGDSGGHAQARRNRVEIACCHLSFITNIAGLGPCGERQ